MVYDKVSQDRYREKHKLEIKKRKHDYYQKIKMEVMSAYSSGGVKCECCEESRIEFMTIDHIFGRGRRHKKQIGKDGSKLYSWLRKNRFPGGFRVLCYNCNCSRGHLGYCPHEKEK
jgi:hypothetical protein